VLEGDGIAVIILMQGSTGKTN